MVMRRLEEALGLPPLHDVLDPVKGARFEKLLARVEKLLARLESFSHDSDKAKELLLLVERMDQNGALTRLDILVKDLQPLAKSKALEGLLGRLEKMAPLLEEILKEK